MRAHALREPGPPRSHTATGDRAEREPRPKNRRPCNRNQGKDGGATFGMGRNVGKPGPRTNPQEPLAESIKEGEDSTKLRQESSAMETEEYGRTRKRSTARG